MRSREQSKPPAKLVGVKGAARYLGVSVKTFRDRIMPHTLAVTVSAASAERHRRMFSIEALDQTVRKLERPAA